MGIYNAKKELYITKRNELLKNIKKYENIYSVGIDAEYIIGSGREFNLEKQDLVNYIIKKYINPFLKNNINVFMIFSGKQIKYYEDLKSYRVNDKLKWQKNIFKAYQNQNNDIIKKNILNYIWTKVSDYINAYPPSCNNPIYDLYTAIFIYNEPEKILNKTNYISYMRKLGNYIWKTSDSMYKLYDYFLIEKNDINLDIIPRDVLWELSYNHWINNMTSKRLSDHIDYVKKYLKNYIPIINSPYDGDDQLVTMVNLGIINAIVSCDSDFFAFKSNIVILDVCDKTNSIEFVKLDDMYKNFENNGYTYDMVRTAMIISSADYNPEFYKYKIPFNISLKTCKKLNNNSYFEIFKYFCKKYKISYDHNVAKEISNAYTVSTKKSDIIDSVNVVINAITDYVGNYNEDNFFHKIYVKLLLLLDIINTSNNEYIKKIKIN